ncbi:DnaJ C-terminal domain-containing protein [Alloalcanivorax mobilis]|uniref:DnaJ C-terminal domain-containing protein n=1 Tax=Alloalcanivorax mobilis TaxID=2019569 RepID=UPI000B5B18AE|nr:DnaJ C-terminal domain-containing protein [Alloalcanivorax mobilis]ASK33976.1 DNA-binding protein [Alcanivorax sp. N3-2A]|tara:strand:- start:28963 stop:29916 length:954 start_codon:yes stop_codon:yes gene_type:complete
MDFKDYYQILGVEPNADDKAVKAAYRRLARKYHPDVSKDDNAEARFKEVAEAYQVLKDSAKRAEYDQLRQYRASGHGTGGGFEPPPGWRPSAGGDAATGHGDFSDFFENLFGAGAQGFSWNAGAAGRHRGEDLEVELPLFLEDTVSDTSKQIRFALPQYDARGRRLADREKTLNVKIPAGTGDNERIRLKGQGAPGLDDAPAGDLYLRVRLVPHPLFDVDGHDLIITVPVAPWEAALGAKVDLPTLTGRLSLTVPAHSQSGRRLRLKGKGLPTKGGAGDLYAVLKVVMPEGGDESADALWRQLAEQADFNPRADWEH